VFFLHWKELRMTTIRWERYPLLAQQEHTRIWLQIQGNLGLAPNTIEAYGRALEGYLHFCQNQGIAPETANREQISWYVHDMTSRPNPRGTQIRVLDSGVGLANATLQQYLTAVRLWYDYLIEEGIRETNPVGRGRYTPGKGFSGARDRGLIPHYKKLPWLPTEEQWRTILEAAKAEPIRNRLMLALAYDAALRREELCALSTGDIDPAHRLIRVRAETTKNMMERMVPYSVATSSLYMAYLQERRSLSRNRGPLFLSESDRNFAAPITIWTWSKVVKRIAERAGGDHSRTGANCWVFATAGGLE
jgi:integrase/recombinase XerD